MSSGQMSVISGRNVVISSFIVYGLFLQLA